MAVGGAVGVISAEGIPVMPCQLRRIDPASMTHFDDPLSAGTLLEDDQQALASLLVDAAAGPASA